MFKKRKKPIVEIYKKSVAKAVKGDKYDKFESI
jgi:hypothetical protein